MKKWVMRVCALALLTGALAGCSAPGIADDRVKVGLNLATRDEFLTSMEAAAVKAAGEENVKLEVANANNDQRAQLAQIEDWAEEGYAAAWWCCARMQRQIKSSKKREPCRWSFSTAGRLTKRCKAVPMSSILAAAKLMPDGCRANTSQNISLRAG